MSSASAERASRLLVILNPSSGSQVADHVRRILHHRSARAEADCDIHEIRPEENLSELARDAAARGCDLIVAAGGDGTVSAVANGLVGTGAKLGILPLGTANVLAGELGVPINLDEACDLLMFSCDEILIDAMRIGERCYFTQVGIGLDALMIRDTRREHKRRFGRLAYVWTMMCRLAGWQPRRFSITIGDRRLRRRASQVLIANSGTLGQRPFRWGPDIRLDDGLLCVCVIRARSWRDYLRVAWNFVRGRHRLDPNVSYVDTDQTVRVDADRPLPVQADGELIGETPVAVEIVPRAVRVLVPPRSSR